MGNKKNIMLISPLWTGVKDFFLKGDEEFKGMPAFTNTFFRLLDNHEVDKIYIFFFGNGIETNFNINKKYINKLEVYGFSYSSKFSAFKSIALLFIKAIKIIVAKNIFVIYGHGSVGGLAGIIGFLTKTPNIRRIYGTFLCGKLNNTKKSIFIKHPLEYLTFSLPAKAIVCTNDGTKGNLVFDKIGHKKSPFYFWLNGIVKSGNDVITYEEVAAKYKINFKPQICYIARIDVWKRQHLLLEALKRLKDENRCCNTIIAGPVINKKYYDDLKSKLDTYKLNEFVKLIPGLTKEETICVIKNSDLSVSFYDFSNLGNVFLESLSMGTVMLTENINNSLELIDKELFYNTSPLDYKQTAEVIKSALNNPIELHEKSHKAITFSHKELLTWHERAQKELALLEI